MKRHEAVVLIVILAGMMLFGATLVAYGQEKAEQKGTKEAAGFTVVRAVVGTGVENNIKSSDLGELKVKICELLAKPRSCRANNERRF